MEVVIVGLRVLLAVWVFGIAWAVDDEELIWKCGRENGLDEGVIMALNESRNTAIVVENEKIKCFFKCIFEETKWMSSEGKLQVGIYDDENKKEEFEHIVMDCMSVKGDFPCETAYLFQQCIFTKKEEEEEGEEQEEQPEEHQEEQGQQEQEEHEDQEEKPEEQQEEGEEKQEQQEIGEKDQEEQEQGEQGQEQQEENQENLEEQEHPREGYEY